MLRLPLTNFTFSLTNIVNHFHYHFLIHLNFQKSRLASKQEMLDVRTIEKSLKLEKDGIAILPKPIVPIIDLVDDSASTKVIH